MNKMNKMTTIKKKFSYANLLYQNLINKVHENYEFKEGLITNPKRTISEFLDLKNDIPNEVKFIVEDQSDSSMIYLNIPNKPDVNNLELTDEELEMVSGGDLALIALGFTIAGSLYTIAKTEGWL